MSKEAQSLSARAAHKMKAAYMTHLISSFINVLFHPTPRSGCDSNFPIFGPGDLQAYGEIKCKLV